MGRLLNVPVLEEIEGKESCYITLQLEDNEKQEEDTNEVIEKLATVDCVAYGNLAEVIINNLDKGDPVGIRGSLGCIKKRIQDGEIFYQIVVLVEKLTCIAKIDPEIEENHLENKQSGFSL